VRVLLADDDPDIRLVARLALKRGGFDVTAVDSGPAVLEQVAAVRPDVILLDWMMPGMDGAETCARLKADPATARIPVVFLTARPADSSVAAALGAAGTLAKPFDPLVLARHVSEILARRDPEKESSCGDEFC
jgi:CheY-like chemotaxis protein